ncbi:ADP-ribosylglycohydrolase family protein [Acidimicrobiaceae bacterium AH-315-P05]|nr:ADP-ribosylglycohydrolase family protein [Acidimicrobiaceae bacterium AH-315-P05]
MPDGIVRRHDCGFGVRWFTAILVVLALVTGGCGSADRGSKRTLSPEVYADKLHGAWQATMLANESGIALQGLWLDEPGPGTEIELLFPKQWSTDDDTHVEWLDLHIMETFGIEPTYEQIRDEWVDNLNNDIWVSTLRARELMSTGVVPPQTGAPELNPEGVWSIDAQLQTELFGMIAPGLSGEARRRATYFARITNSGLAVEVSAFYAHLYSEAFMQSDIEWLLDRALRSESVDSEVSKIVENVRRWHQENQVDWRITRNLIRDAYDTDPEWWASRVNFAVTIMALLYGESDLIATLNIAGLAGWDADNNMTTAAGLLGVIVGFEGLPESVKNSTDVYFNQDLIGGDLPEFDSVANIADRTRKIGELVIRSAGGTAADSGLVLPLQAP